MNRLRLRFRFADLVGELKLCRYRMCQLLKSKRHVVNRPHAELQRNSCMQALADPANQQVLQHSATWNRRVNPVPTERLHSAPAATRRAAA